jgi:mRNA interferase HigB
MRIISKARLRKYWAGHRDDETSLRTWHRIVKSASWKCFADIKATFNSVDPYKENRRKYHIFNVGGNNVRIITAIHFNTQIVYIRMVLSHDEYSKNKWKELLC